MTKETHRQKIVLTECVTPNMPKIRGSFFNRKYRESGGSNGQLTPSTSNSATSRSGNRSSNSTPRSRAKRSGGKSDRLTLSRSSGKDRYQPNRSRPSSGYIEQDFSTPRATRASLLTPISGSNMRDGKITHFYYRPLELDNDSSSESIEDAIKRKQIGSQNETTEDSSSKKKPVRASNARDKPSEAQAESKLKSEIIRNSRITHFHYRPLELDNETSSESMDSIMRRKYRGSHDKLTVVDPQSESPTKKTTALKRRWNEMEESTAKTATGWELPTIV